MKSISNYFFSFLFTEYFQWGNDSNYVIDNSMITFSSVKPTMKTLNSFLSLSQLNILINSEAISSFHISLPIDIYTEAIIIQCSLCNITIKPNKEIETLLIDQYNTLIPNIIFDSHSELNREISLSEWEIMQSSIETKMIIKFDRIYYDILILSSSSPIDSTNNNDNINIDLINLNYSLVPMMDESKREIYLRNITCLLDLFIFNNDESNKKYVNILKDARIEIKYNDINNSYNKIQIECGDIVLDDSLEDISKLLKSFYSFLYTLQSFFSVEIKINTIKGDIRLNKSNILITASNIIYNKDYNVLFPSFQFNQITIQFIQEAFISKILLSLKQITLKTYRVFIKEINQSTNEKNKITSNSFTLSIKKTDDDNTLSITINLLSISLSFELLQNIISLFKELRSSSILSQSLLLLSSSYSISISIPVILIHLGKRLQFIDKYIFLPAFTFQIDSFSFKSTLPSLANTIVTAILTVKIINPLYQTIDPIISNMAMLYEKSSSKGNKHIFNIANCSIAINSLAINSIDNIINNQFDLYSTIQNCTSNVFEVSFFNESFSFFLSPGMKSHIIHNNAKIKLSINDIEYESTIAISKLFKHYFDKELYNNYDTVRNKSNSANNEIVYHTRIELKSDKHLKKRLTLMYKINKSNLLHLHLIIFDTLIVIRKFPSFNILNFIIAKSNEITSIERTPETNIGIIVELKPNDNEGLSSSKLLSQSQSMSLPPAISFECDNALFCNYFLQDIDIIIDYNSDSQSHHIQGRNELSLSINFQNLQSIKLSIKYSDMGYLSENILKSLSTMNSIQKITLFSYSKAGLCEQSSLSLNILIEDLISSPLISNAIKQDINYSKYTMKIIKLLPHILLRNYTSCKGFMFSFIHNSACNQINQKTLSLIDSNSNDKIESNNLLVEINNNSTHITNRESTLILNDKPIQNSNSVFALNKIVFMIKFNSIETLYFSDAIQITKIDNDIIFPIEICSNFYFFFRMRARYINEGILSLTLSSLFNINLKGGINEVFIKNKIELPRFEMYSNGNISNDSDDISYDTIFKVNDRLSEININDVFAFYAFIKKIENTLEIFINKQYYSPLVLIDLFTKDNYQLCCHYQGIIKDKDKDRDSGCNDNNNKMSKVYHVRMLHNPFFICELYDAFVNISQYWYMFIDNQLANANTKEGIASIYYHTENTKDINDIQLEKGSYEMLIKDKLRTLIVTINSVNYFIIKDSIVIHSQILVENSILVSYEMQMNTYRIVIKANSQMADDKGNQLASADNFSFTLTKVSLQINILPFFAYTNIENKSNYDFVVSTDKILLNYIPNQTINFSLPNLFISKGKLQFFSTTYLADIKVDSIPLYSHSLKLYYDEYRINLPYQMSMTIDDNSIQCLNFLLSQLNSNKKPQTSHLLSSRDNILNIISLSPLAKIYMINEIKVNDFSVNMNIEYKKGLNFTIKNSTIIHKYVQMKTIIGTSNEIYQKIKNNLMSNFFSNFYSLLSSTEIFGNWNEIIKSVKTGISKFKERPFSFGIINLVYDSVKGGVNSFLGIGKSVAKTLRHIQSGNYNFEIYNQYNALVNRHKESNEVKMNRMSTIALCYDVICRMIGEEFKVDYCFIVEYNKTEVLVIDNKYYFILVNFNMMNQGTMKIELLFPYYKINDIQMIMNDDKRIVLFKMENNTDKEYVLEFNNSFEQKYFHSAVLNKFNLIQ